MSTAVTDEQAREWAQVRIDTVRATMQEKPGQFQDAPYLVHVLERYLATVGQAQMHAAVSEMWRKALEFKDFDEWCRIEGVDQEAIEFLLSSIARVRLAAIMEPVDGETRLTSESLLMHLLTTAMIAFEAGWESRKHAPVPS